MTQKKAPKGSVQVKTTISSAGVGWLRLVWSHQGKRYFLSLGLEDNPLNQMVAQRLALQIQGDCATGNFDSSLIKYKPQSEIELKPVTVSVVGLIERYLIFKQQQIESETLYKYNHFLPRIREYFGNNSLTEKSAFGFRDWLLQHNEPATVRERIVFLNAVYEWGIKKQLVEVNHWTEVSVKVPPKRRLKPFSIEEIKRILEGFATDQYYSHYLPYVEFLLGTGCRPGEANGLQWKHISEDCGEVLISCKLTVSGERKSTKTNRDRLIPLPPRLQNILKAIRPIDPDPEAPVFVSLTGLPIDSHNFRNRAWKQVLAKVGVEYRKPGNCRHTLISHGLSQGKSPAEMAELAGNRIETIYNNYAGSVIHRPSLPELFVDDE